MEKENRVYDEILDKRYDYKNNSFYILKIVLSIMVIVYHAYCIFFGQGSLDIISKILKTETIGGIAVNGFLIISGFMIMQSALHSKNTKEFLLKRIFKIFPTLIFMLLLTVLIVIPLGMQNSEVSKKSVMTYFISNINLLGNPIYGIHGVFMNNPYPEAINGSLWTLKHEFTIYIIFAIFLATELIKNRKIVLGLLIVFIGLYIINPEISVGNFLKYIGIIKSYKQFIRLFMYFLMGSTMYLYRDKIKMNFKIFMISIMLIIISILFGKVEYSLIFTLPYIIIYLGTMKSKIDMKRLGDLSYGLYIYAFPIQQLLICYFYNNLNIYTFILLSIIVTVIVALLSWHLVEKHFMKIKKRLSKNVGRENIGERETV